MPAVNPANNQFTGTGYSYGPKGNLLGLNNFSFVYDPESRMSSATTGSFVETYNYDESNLRVEKQSSSGAEIYFYGPGGKLLTIFGGTSPIGRVYLEECC